MKLKDQKEHLKWEETVGLDHSTQSFGYREVCIYNQTYNMDTNNKITEGFLNVLL